MILIINSNTDDVEQGVLTLSGLVCVCESVRVYVVCISPKLLFFILFFILFYYFFFFFRSVITGRSRPALLAVSNLFV
jgi:hypothetical protein